MRWRGKRLPLPERWVRSEVTITASPERVWRVLSDFERYAEWNPLIVRVVGAARAGARLRASVRAPGRRLVTLSPRVVGWEEGRELRLRARLGPAWLLEADHRFIIRPAGEGGSVRFEHSERFSGLLVLALSGLLKRDLARGFAEMNEALRARVEAWVGPAAGSAR
ncbi:MAG TPA: SRPBCC domain-containing protein [Chloroflexota bacterium]|jgi:hypothetical protein|nr:SRPBCC domain-containing protein [Chloroflexota bacterium]